MFPCFMNFLFATRQVHINTRLNWADCKISSNFCFLCVKIVIWGVMQCSLVEVHHLVGTSSHPAGVGCGFVCNHGTPKYLVSHLRIWLIKTNRRHFQTHVRWLSWLGLSLPIQSMVVKNSYIILIHDLTSSCILSFSFNLVLSYV
jgi:hypothetical protein